MTDYKNTALAFCETDKLLYIGVADGIKNYGYNVLYADESGLVCHLNTSNLIVIASDSLDATKKLLGKTEVTPDIVFCLNEHSYKYVSEHFGFTGLTVCTQGVYLKDEPVEYEFDYEIKQLDFTHMDFVCKNYDKTSDEETRERIQLGQMIGAFSKDGKIMGFIGTHSEGTVGMLLVMPEFRRMGVAYAIEAEMTNRVLREGRLPWCHIIVGNDASTSLQKKLGYIFSDKTIYWMY